MKKSIIIATLLFLCINAYSQEEEYPYPFKFSHTDSCNSCTKDDLYNAALLWVANTFNSAKNVIDLQDKETGTIICKALIEVPGQKNGFGVPLGNDYVDYKLTIRVKGGKYKISVSDFSERGGSYNYSQSFGSLDQDEVRGLMGAGMRKYWGRVKENAQIRSEALISDFRIAMKTKGGDDF